MHIQFIYNLFIYLFLSHSKNKKELEDNNLRYRIKPPCNKASILFILCINVFLLSPAIPEILIHLLVVCFTIAFSSAGLSGIRKLKHFPFRQSEESQKIAFVLAEQITHATLF